MMFFLLLPRNIIFQLWMRACRNTHIVKNGIFSSGKVPASGVDKCLMGGE